MFTPNANPPPRDLGTPTVFIVDSNAAARESLALLIRSEGWWPCTMASAEEFLAAPRPAAPNCLITELQLPGLSGLELQKLVLDRTETPIIFLSASADVHASVQAMKSGALEFIPKPYVRATLLDALRDATDRSRETLRRRAQIRALRQRYESLSPREREVMNLVVSGRLNKQVGGVLGITEDTVKAHRGSLMRKMKAGSFAELVTMALGLNSLTVSWMPALPSPEQLIHPHC